MKTLSIFVLVGLMHISASAAFSIADQAMDSTKYELPKTKEKAGRDVADTGKKVIRVKGRDK